MLMSRVGPYTSKGNNGHFEQNAQPYCHCWDRRGPITWSQLNTCSCGEDNDVREWNWKPPDSDSQSWVMISEDHKQVTFHPFHSSGTAAVKGDTALEHDYHYYWEIKMLTDTYGTDIMVGLGTDKVNVTGPLFEFTSLLGRDAESYGLSYKGTVRHNATETKDLPGFCKGSIVGVRVDMWRGTLEFFLNRRSQGISFYNLRRHRQLFPMVCSTAAQSSVRLIYAASWKASLLVDAARILAAAVCPRPRMPPGLYHELRSKFWLTLPTEGCSLDQSGEGRIDDEEMKVASSIPLPAGMKRRHWQMSPPACFPQNNNAA